MPSNNSKPLWQPRDIGWSVHDQDPQKLNSEPAWKELFWWYRDDNLSPQAKIGQFTIQTRHLAAEKGHGELRGGESGWKYKRQLSCKACNADLALLTKEASALPDGQDCIRGTLLSQPCTSQKLNSEDSVPVTEKLNYAVFTITNMVARHGHDIRPRTMLDGSIQLVCKHCRQAAFLSLEDGEVKTEYPHLFSTRCAADPASFS